MKSVCVNMSDTECEGSIYPATVPEKPETPENQTCPAIGYQRIAICAPVEVTPFANAGATITRCIGKAVVTPGTNICPGDRGGSCYFTISQTICIEVSIEFGAEATVGDPSIDCIDASADDICNRI